MKHFGTDGIRKVAHLFTHSYLSAVAQAIAQLENCCSVVIGRDNRISGGYMAESLTGCLLSCGIRVTDVGILTSPALALCVRELHSDYGVMLTASHNPPEYNGIKLFNRYGEKISEEEENFLSDKIDNPHPVLPNSGTLTYENGIDIYCRSLIKKVDISLDGVEILLDCANGATSVICEKIFPYFGAEVHLVNCSGGERINCGCGAAHPAFLLRQKTELSFAFDGDGDRVCAVCDRKLLNGDRLCYVLASDMKDRSMLFGDTAVGTVMSELGVERALRAEGIEFIRTPVGDRNIYDVLKRNGFSIGGEDSGHIILPDYENTGDGILTALLLADLHRKKSLPERCDFPSLPKVRFDVAFPEEKFLSFNCEECRKKVSENVRSVIRKSGTEPLVRVLLEGEYEEEVRMVEEKMIAYLKEAEGGTIIR